MEVMLKHKELLKLQSLPIEARSGELWDAVCANAEQTKWTVIKQLEWEILCASSAVASQRAFKWESINWRGLY